MHGLQQALVRDTRSTGQGVMNGRGNSRQYPPGNSGAKPYASAPSVEWGPSRTVGPGHSSIMSECHHWIGSDRASGWKPGGKKGRSGKGQCAESQRKRITRGHPEEHAGQQAPRSQGQD